MDLSSLDKDMRQKLKHAQTVAARATRRESEADYDEAFQLYLSSAQSYLYLIRNIPDQALKENLKQTSSKLLNRAEQIKSHRRLTRPVVRDRISLEEQDLVIKASARINGNLFPSWNSSVDNRLLTIQPPLNDAQKQIFQRWVSISDLKPNIPIYKPGNLDPSDIVQDVVTDCSLIASFAVSTNHANRFPSKLNVACLYPKDREGNPMKASDGIYRVKLLLNGIYRQIPVDDKIPTGINRPMMCAQSRREDFFWPAIIEKAYMKVMDGYDFVGSNSSIDLNALTGWIPETIFTTSEEYRGETTWRRILQGFEKGHCLVTVGTNGNISDALDSVGLVPFHDYAILDISEDTNGRRLLTLYNAWNTQPDKSSDSWTSELRNALPGIKINRRTELIGTFTVSWESLQIYFETVHLNWDPKIFGFQQTVHFSDAPPPAFKLQFENNSHSKNEVWILLTRHLSAQRSDCERYMSFNVFLEENDEELINSTNYIPQPIVSTMLSNATHLLARFIPTYQQATTTYLINFNFHEPQNSNNKQTSNIPKLNGYTLNVYSNFSCIIQDAGPISLPYTFEIEGKWTSRTSGGNHGLSSFMNNPMWRIKIGTSNITSVSGRTFKASLTAIDTMGDLESGKPLNVKLVRADGDGRVYDVEARDLVADSGSYTRGQAQLRVGGILPGNYTIVPSTFEAGIIGSFKLRLESELPIIKVTQIPAEGAGMYKRITNSTWQEERNLEKPGWKVSGGKGNVKVKFRVQATTTKDPGICPMKLVLLNWSSPQESSQVIASCSFIDALSGAAIGPIQMSFTENSRFVVLVEAIGDTSFNSGSGYILSIYADQPLTVDRC